MAQKHTFQLTTFIECVDHRVDEISSYLLSKSWKISNRINQSLWKKGLKFRSNFYRLTLHVCCFSFELFIQQCKRKEVLECYCTCWILEKYNFKKNVSIWMLERSPIESGEHVHFKEALRKCLDSFLQLTH